MTSPLVATLGAAPFTIDDLDALASGPARLTLSDAARALVAASRAVVEHYAARDEPIYGLNTGLGANLGFRVARAEIEDFQEQLVRGRTMGAGESFPEPVCRAALISRCVAMAQGGAGISQPVLDLLLAMVERGVTPVIPRRGSIGAGDLGLAAHIGAVALGRGEAWHAGNRQPGGAALAAAGLTPVKLGAKDGHALCNASAVTTGHAALALADASRLLLFAVHAAALADEGYAANPLIFDARISALRPAARQQDAAALFRRLLEGSYLNDAGGAQLIQDPLSFRCLAPIMGVVLQAHADARREVEIELNAAADSPVVLLSDGSMPSTANFHTPAIALAFDVLAIAFTHMATACFHRISKLMSPALSGLPRYLSPVGGGSAGYVPIQKLCAALLGEVRLRAAPASLDAMPVSDTIEDVAPQTPLAIAKLADQLEPLRILVAVEALVAVQAIDLRGVRLAPRTRRLYDAVRAVVPPLETDREPAPDIERVVALAADRGVLAELAVSLDGLDLSFLPRFSAVAHAAATPSITAPGHRRDLDTEGLEILFLSRHDIEELAIPLEDVLQAVEAVVRAQGEGKVTLDPRVQHVPDPAYPGHFNVLRATVWPLDVSGVKVVGDYVENYRVGLPSELALVTLYDPRTGTPLAIVDATEITERRTGALTALGARELAREGSKVLAHIGARGTAFSNVTMLDHYFDFDEIRATSRRRESRELFARSLEEALGKPVRVVDTIEEAVVGAQIVVEATRLTEPEPLLKTAWLEACNLLVPYGAKSVLELDVLEIMDKVLVDDWAQCKRDDPFGSLRPHVRAGLLTDESLYGELAEVVAGKKPGRERDDERILFWHRGLATTDVALAHLIVRRAVERGLGTTLRYR